MAALTKANIKTSFEGFIDAKFPLGLGSQEADDFADAMADFILDILTSQVAITIINGGVDTQGDSLVTPTASID